MRRTRLLAAAVTALALVANPAFGSHGDVHPSFRTEQTYFTCPGPTKVHQVNWPLAVAGLTTNPSWSTSAPGSAQGGAGCGAADWAGTTNALYSPAFVGKFTGNLRDMTIRVHQLLTHNVRQSGTETLRLAADIDGIPLFLVGAQPEHGRTVTVTPTVTNNSVTELYEFSITNIGYANDVLDAEGNVVGVERGGAALEDGIGAEEHTITIYLGLHGPALSTNSDPTKYEAATWAWGASEVAGGITFNPTQLAPAKVAADLPQYER